MIYLLVNHVPFAPAPVAGKYRVDPAMLVDLRAQARAIAAVGGRLILAAPFAPAGSKPVRGHERGAVQITPDDEGFEYIPLPRYTTLREYWAVSDALAAALVQAIQPADVVQADYGGHPVMLGEIAWPIAGRLGKKRVWVFDSADPFAQTDPKAPRAVNPLRRAARSRRTAHRLEFCAKAVAEADLVFSFNPEMMHRLRETWDERRCHTFAPPPTLTDDLVLTPTALETAMRQRSDRRLPLRLLCAGRYGAPARDSVASPKVGGVGDALRALTHCRRLSVPVTLTVVGQSGAALRHLREMASGMAMEQHVQFVDSAVSTLSDAMISEHDVLLVATPETDRFDPELLRAMARGLAVVTYENVATDRLLESTDAARIVPVGNVLLLAQAVIDLQQNRRKLIELSEAAWRFAAARTLEARHRRRAELAAELCAAACGGRVSNHQAPVAPRSWM